MTAADIREAGYKLSANTPQALIDRMEHVVERFVFLILKNYDTEILEELGDILLQTPAFSYGLVYIGCVNDEVYATRTGGERKRNDYGVCDTDLLEVKSEIVGFIKSIIQIFSMFGTIEVKPLNTSYDPFGLFFKTQFFY